MKEKAPATCFHFFFFFFLRVGEGVGGQQKINWSYNQIKPFIKKKKNKDKYKNQCIIITFKLVEISGKPEKLTDPWKKELSYVEA